MPNANFFPKWAFERPLPKPFDCFSGRDAVFKDISSKYCIQPRKHATLHSATLQAVFSYMDLENPPAGKTEEELGAIGSQANNFTIAEYPSRTGLLHVVVYNLSLIHIFMNITHFQRGNGLISTNNNNITVEFKASNLEKELITTDRQELLEILKRQDKKVG